MVEKDQVYSQKVKHTGIWDFKETYRYLYDWLIDNDYLVTERSYNEKITPTGKEIEIAWEAKRKISDYFRFVLKLHWRILGMTDVEVKKGDAKVKMNKGYIEIKFTAVLEKDYEHRWENSSILKFLRGVYDRYIIRGRIEDYETKLFSEVDELIAQTKSWLALEGKH